MHGMNICSSGNALPIPSASSTGKPIQVKELLCLSVCLCVYACMCVCVCVRVCVLCVCVCVCEHACVYVGQSF